MKKGEAKARNLAWQAAARALLEEREGDQISLQELAHVLKERAGCSYDTAKRHLERAAAGSPSPQWGGAHGGHAPPKEKPIKSITIRQDTSVMISQVYPDGIAPLGRGAAQVKRTPAGRMIVIPQEDGSEIRILVF